MSIFHPRFAPRLLAARNDLALLPMILIDTPVTVRQVLHAFHRDAPYLFLGAAFITVGIVSVAFCALRRRFDALLVWMAIFAGLYGVRLWLQSHVLRIDLGSSIFFDRVRIAISYLVPVPAVYFFRAAGFVVRGAKVIVPVASALFLCLFAGTLEFGPLPVFNV